MGVRGWGLDIISFADEHLGAAGELLARRHRASRQAEPLLPARFEQQETTQAAVEDVWRTPGTTGMAAMDGAQLRGFLLGTAQINTFRGRSVWVPFVGHAVDPDAGAELYRDLYAALSPRWVAAGCFAHYAIAAIRNRQYPRSGSTTFKRASPAWKRRRF